MLYLRPQGKKKAKSARKLAAEQKLRKLRRREVRLKKDDVQDRA